MNEPNDDVGDVEPDGLDEELRDLVHEAHGGAPRFWRGLALAVLISVALIVVVAFAVLYAYTPAVPLPTIP